MNWRVEIRNYNAETLTHGDVVDKFESTDLKVAIHWWNKNWIYKWSGSMQYSMQVYANNKELDFTQIFDLGFFTPIIENRGT